MKKYTVTIINSDSEVLDIIQIKTFVVADGMASNSIREQLEKATLKKQGFEVWTASDEFANGPGKVDTKI